jgi:AcrR family transcriptional regulator
VTDVSTAAGVAPGPAADTAPRAAPSEGDELRERLLRAAAAVFARQGYDGTKIMDIVRESGLSTGAVYGRFRSKNDLLREAIVTHSARAARVGPDPDRVADLITLVATHTGGALSDAEAVRLEAYVTARREPDVAAALDESYRVFSERMVPLVAEARVDGTVADDVDPDAVLFLVRVLNLGLLLHRGSGLPGPDDDAWRALVDRIVASFGRTPTAAGDAPGRGRSPETETHPDPDTDAPTRHPEDPR